jgi:fucose permease
MAGASIAPNISPTREGGHALSSETIESTTTVSDYWVSQREKLFWASCISLIVTAMSFAIRGNLIAPLGKQFDLTNEQLGIITGTAFWGFAITTIIGGWLCDVVGMGKLLTLAFVGHTVGILTTIFAGAFGKGNGFTTLFLGTLAFGLANGLVEAACNPLIATLYPEEKIKRLNRFHMWFPGGIVIGGLLGYAIEKSGIGASTVPADNHNWQIQMLTMVLPLIVYGVMFFGKKFPKTERSASGVSMGEMFKACLTPLFLVFLACMVCSSATELVTGQWMPNILTVTTGWNGILFLVLINGLAAIGRAFAGDIVHRMSPVAMLIGSSAFSAIGMFMLTKATNGTSALVASVIFAIGICFFWPTMLGVVSERFPRTGALGMSIMGGTGMMSTAIFLPLVGKYYDQGIATTLNNPNPTQLDAFKSAAAGTPEAAQWAHAQVVGGNAGLNVLVILPVILLFIFLAIFMYDKSRGGYKKEILVQDQ